MLLSQWSHISAGQVPQVPALAYMSTQGRHVGSQDRHVDIVVLAVDSGEGVDRPSADHPPRTAEPSHERRDTSQIKWIPSTVEMGPVPTLLSLRRRPHHRLGSHHGYSRHSWLAHVRHSGRCSPPKQRISESGPFPRGTAEVRPLRPHVFARPRRRHSEEISRRRATGQGQFSVENCVTAAR
jgi:hypothetical protein